MTEMYKCDKCGRIFDNYEEAELHEQAHWNYSCQWFGMEVEEGEYMGQTRDVSDILDRMTTYKENGQDAPDTIVVGLKRWNGEKMKYESTFAKYVFKCYEKLPTE